MWGHKGRSSKIKLAKNVFVHNLCQSEEGWDAHLVLMEVYSLNM